VPEHVEVSPRNFNKMIEIAYKLSSGQRFLRVDLYNVNGKIYFGELTFFPSSGLTPFAPDSADNEIGALMSLENLN
jgi:hypothetical protein